MKLQLSFGPCVRARGPNNRSYLKSASLHPPGSRLYLSARLIIVALLKSLMKQTASDRAFIRIASVIYIAQRFVRVR